MTLIEKLVKVKLTKITMAYRLERWVTSNLDNVCPMCAELEKLEWVPMGILPTAGNAHLELGEGRWKGGDTCRCTKKYKNVNFGKKPEGGKLIFNPRSKTYRVEYCEDLEEGNILTHQEATKRIAEIKQKYSCTKTNCNHDHDDIK